MPSKKGRKTRCFYGYDAQELPGDLDDLRRICALFLLTGALRSAYSAY